MSLFQFHSKAKIDTVWRVSYSDSFQIGIEE